MKKILLSVAVIGVAGALAVNATTALFSDVEKSTGNTFTAGEVDLLVDSEQHYAGMICDENPEYPADLTAPEYVWQLEAAGGSSARPELLGKKCTGTWEETDLGPTYRFFDFEDVKPGDEGENTISLHLKGNDSYVCAIIDNMKNDDNGCNEPELKAEENPGPATCGDPNNPGDGEGELADEIYFFAWADNGDNVWETGESPLFSNLAGPASDVLDGVAYPLYTPATGAMTEDTTIYIGLYWCLGELTFADAANGDYTPSCNGAPAGNITQSDSLSADITFYVEQARNNPNFVCPVPDPV